MFYSRSAFFMLCAMMSTPARGRDLGNGAFLALTSTKDVKAFHNNRATRNKELHRNHAIRMPTDDDDDEIDAQDQGVIKVAIIGGGIAGLSCASHLLSYSSSLPSGPQFRPTVFDTGRLRPGGRCSSRLPGDVPKFRPGKGSSRNRIVFQQSIVDHAAQILTIPTTAPSGHSNEWTAFAQQVEIWEKQGILKKFPPFSVGEIVHTRRRQQQQELASKISKRSNHSAESSAEEKFLIRWINPTRTRNEPERTMYYGAMGMSSIPRAIVSGSSREKENRTHTLHIEQNVWISPSNGITFVGKSSSDSNDTNNQSTTPLWSVQSNAQSYGNFDRIVIAHNGKCAHRLTANTPAKELHQLLDTNFYYSVPKTGGTKMTLNSIYSLTFALKLSEEGSDQVHESTPKDRMEKNASQNNLNASPARKVSVLGKAVGQSLICAFIKNEPNLRFLTCQSRKFPHTNDTTRTVQTTVRKDTSDYEIWTVFSSPKLAKDFKAPQENVPQEIQEQVIHIMLASLETSLNLPPGALSPSVGGSVVDTYLQLWGAAVPLNTWNNKRSGDDKLPESLEVLGEASAPYEMNGFVYDARHGIGACGDWLLDPSIAGSWESGRRLAKNMIQAQVNLESIGLPPSGTFRASAAASEAALGNLG